MTYCHILRRGCVITMKKLLALVLMIAMLLPATAMVASAEEKTAEELLAMIAQLEQELAELRGEETESATAEATPEPTYTEYARGAKGEEVKPLQQRLKDLGYLTGTVDGDFGGGTERAVSAFQNQHKIPVTGIADVATQELLFSDKAEQAIVYESLEYKAVSRDPDKYEGRYVKFNGKVLQVIEDGDLVAFRIASKGNYDDVVFVIMEVPDDYSRILEDDRVEVSGKYGGLYSYETVRGDTITIPLVDAEMVILR